MSEDASRRWMTYAEIAAALNLPSAKAGEAKARRARWERMIGNDGFARVAVPLSVLDEPYPLRRARAEGGPRVAEAPTQGLPVNALLAELKASHERIGRAEGERDTARATVAALQDDVQSERARANAEQERAARAEAERDTLKEALRAAQATAEDAGRQARTAEERAAAAHQRAAEVTAVIGRVAAGLEHIRQTRATAAEVVAAARAEREAALTKVEAAAQQVGEAEARAAEASRRAVAAEARLDDLQQLPAEATALNMAELEAAQARATEAERQAAEAERKANTANERLDRFQRERIIHAQEAAARASEAAELANLEAEAQRPLWQRIFRRRRRP